MLLPKLGVLIAAVRAQKPSCYTCQSTYDHNMVAQGISDQGCFDDATIDISYSQECLNDDDVCVVDVEVDWFLDGSQNVITRRGCGSPGDDYGCSGNYEIFPTPMQLFKDCRASCDPEGGPADNCNGFELYDEIMDLFDERNDPENPKLPISCHICSYSNSNGIVNGNEACITGSSSIPTAACPKYANAACFTAAAWDDEVVNGDKQSFVQDHRGCSAFVFGTTAGTDCQSGQTPNGQFSECKYTCNDENCNTNELIKRKTCNTCTGTRYSDNSTVGVTDGNCFELMGGRPQAGYSEVCENEDDVCVTELEVDWLPRGLQQATVRRGCKPVEYQPIQDPCLYQNIVEAGFEYKDCSVVCETSDCNVGIDEVAALFASDTPQDSCAVCNYHEDNNGNIQGNKDCKDAPETTATCPLYANSGCYVGSNIHFVDGFAREDVYRGCSTFDRTSSQETECTNRLG